MDSVFERYRDLHKGRSAYLIGTGPSVKEVNLDHLQPDFYRIGVNETVHLNVDLDYWFMGDSTYQDPDKFLNQQEFYRSRVPAIARFLRINEWPGGERCQMPTDWPLTEYYRGKWVGNPDTCAFTDLGQEPVNCVASITFDALQFILHTGITTIYLIGHDCDYSQGTFTGSMVGKHHNAGHWILKYWGVVAKWLEENRPDVKIYSVNPVGLTLFEEATLC